MGVPEMCAGVAVKLVSERVSLVGGTLSDVRDTVVVLGAFLVNTVPMDDQLQTVHVVQNVDDHLVTFADLNTQKRAKDVRRTRSNDFSKRYHGLDD